MASPKEEFEQRQQDRDKDINQTSQETLNQISGLAGENSQLREEVKRLSQEKEDLKKEIEEFKDMLRRAEEGEDRLLHFFRDIRNALGGKSEGG